MLDEYGFEIYEENEFPVAYLLTFRTYGTWLHGDQRGSFQRRRNEPIATIKVDPNVPLLERMVEMSSHNAILLNENQRMIVGDAIAEVCKFRRYELRAISVRTNHAHAVVSKAVKPEKIVNDFKAYATRKLRDECEFPAPQKIWARGASTRYLWKPRHVQPAVEYVLYSQGDILFEEYCED
ncbi:MAG: transposase [Pyrinomonadaceae bacterium]